MIVTEKVRDNETARCIRMIECTPKLLREFAERLEHGDKERVGSEVVQVPFTTGIVLVYQPEPTFVSEGTENGLLQAHCDQGPMPAL